MEVYLVAKWDVKERLTAKIQILMSKHINNVYLINKILHKLCKVNILKLAKYINPNWRNQRVLNLIM